LALKAWITHLKHKIGNESLILDYVCEKGFFVENKWIEFFCKIFNVSLIMNNKGFVHFSMLGVGIQPKKLKELEGDENPNNNYLVQTPSKIQACGTKNCLYLP
jgi:hypothetical protein